MKPSFKEPDSLSAPALAPNSYKQKATKRPISVKLCDVNRPPWEVEMGIRGTYGLLMGKPKSLVRGKVSNSLNPQTMPCPSTKGPDC